MSKRLWLRDYLDLVKDTEVPESFAFWCGVAGISAALGRRVVMDMGIYKIYPNMFIILVASSGKCRKGTAIGMIEDMIWSMNPMPNVISQKITPEALIEALRTSETDSGGKIIKETCEGFVIAEELATFLNKKSYESGLGSLIIEMYNCKDRFRYRTKSRGVELITNACLGLLGGSTIDWVRNAIPEDAIGSGLTSRIVFVYESKPKDPVAFTSVSEEQRELIKGLSNRLQKMCVIEGVMRMSESAREWYEKEYISFYKNSPFYHDRLLAGYASRRAVHLLKLGMIISVSDEREGWEVVEVEHLRMGLRLLEQAEQSMGEVLGLLTTTQTGVYVSTVRELIYANNILSRSDIIRAFSNQMQSREVDEVLKTLVVSGDIVPVKEGKTTFYKKA